MSKKTKLLFILQMWSKDCGNIQKPAKHATKFSQKGDRGFDAPMAAQASLISGCDTF
jgi:hypothetical protein